MSHGNSETEDSANKNHCYAQLYPWKSAMSSRLSLDIWYLLILVFVLSVTFFLLPRCVIFFNFWASIFSVEVQVSSVDAFQGCQKDVIILSLVRANPRPGYPVPVMIGLLMDVMDMGKCCNASWWPNKSLQEISTHTQTQDGQTPCQNNSYISAWTTFWLSFFKHHAISFSNHPD